MLPYYNIQFVSSTTLSVNLEPEICSKKQNKELNGEEISQFYTNLVSEPSKSCIQPTPRPPGKVDTNIKELKHSMKSSKPKTQLNILRSAQEGNLDGIAHCLNEGVNVNLLDSFGWSPLMCAACSGATDVVNFLLKNGADPSITDSQGRTFLDLAHQHGHLHILMSVLGRSSEGRVSTRHDENKQPAEFCSLCEVHYKERCTNHRASIVHQLNCNHTPRPAFYHLPETNIGFQFMIKDGWDKEHGLGPTGTGQKFPVKTVLKRNRHGLGHGSKSRPRVTHFDPFDTNAVKQHYHNNQPKSRTVQKRKREKRERRDKQKEIDFRNQFHS